jgi:hypothetical protein
MALPRAPRNFTISLKLSEHVSGINKSLSAFLKYCTPFPVCQVDGPDSSSDEKESDEKRKGRNESEISPTIAY